MRWVAFMGQLTLFRVTGSNCSLPSDQYGFFLRCLNLESKETQDLMTEHVDLKMFFLWTCHLLQFLMILKSPFESSVFSRCFWTKLQEISCWMLVAIWTKSSQKNVRCESVGSIGLWVQVGTGAWWKRDHGLMVVWGFNENQWVGSKVGGFTLQEKQRQWCCFQALVVKKNGWRQIVFDESWPFCSTIRSNWLADCGVWKVATSTPSTFEVSAFMRKVYRNIMK